MTDVTVALPEPGDIQVATGWPQVDAYRAALIHAERLAYKADVLARSLEATRRRVPATTAKRQEIRDRAYRKYRAAADEHERAVNAAASAEQAAYEVAPAAAKRVWLSLETYSARLNAELQTHRERCGLTAA